MEIYSGAVKCSKCFFYGQSLKYSDSRKKSIYVEENKK